MRSAHGGGFLYALGAKLGITAPDIMVGSSGDAANIAYFSTGQYENIKRIWENELSTHRFISPLRFWRLMDIGYLVDTVFRQREPLDVPKLRSSAIRWFVPITDFETGLTRYVSAEDNMDVFEMLRASAAIPILFGKKFSYKAGCTRMENSGLCSKTTSCRRYDKERSGSSSSLIRHRGRTPHARS